MLGTDGIIFKWLVLMPKKISIDEGIDTLFNSPSCAYILNAFRCSWQVMRFEEDSTDMRERVLRVFGYVDMLCIHLHNKMDDFPTFARNGFSSQCDSVKIDVH